MTNDYKLCPKCNNALDNNIMQCPYCGEKLGISFGTMNKPGFTQNKLPSNQTKKSGGLGCLIIFVIFFILPFISGIISFIFSIISSLFK